MRNASCLLLWLVIMSGTLRGDGKVMPPRDYKGSLEERSQEALIIFHSSDKADSAKEDLILKIQVEGRASQFAWVIPFPNQPEVAKESPELFRELFNCAQAAKQPTSQKGGLGGAKSAEAEPKLEVLKREVVGSFDVAIVRENQQGGLNPWLEQEGFQKLENADDVLDFYRKKKYVFACIKVTAEALSKDGSIESHPLRFTFRTGGRDGIYFPMKLTGLQKEPFDVNLYILYRYWLNDNLTKYGYKHRGFKLEYRDWDSELCEPNGGKQYSLPEKDPFLRSHAHLFPTVTKLVRKLHLSEKYYLTNIRANGLKPEEVRAWADDLWLFPYYTNKSFVPYDAKPGGVAAATWAAE